MTIMLEKHAETWAPRSPKSAAEEWVVIPSTEPTDTWPRMAAFEYARHDLDRLMRDLEDLDLPAPSDIARRRLLGVLRSVLARNSVFPTITYDDSDSLLLAEWRAGARRIEIEVDDEGQAVFTIVSRRGVRVYRGPSETRLRSHLRDLTSEVVASNPKWRSLFTGRH